MTVLQGEIRPYAPAARIMRQRYVLVVSNTEYHEQPRSRPLCMDVETVMTPLVSVPFSEGDPAELHGAVVSVGSIAPRDPAWLGEPVGLVSGATLARVHRHLAMLLDMPR